MRIACVPSFRCFPSAAIFSSVTPAIANDLRWSLSTAVNYSVGDYGTDEDTTIVYVPFTLGVPPSTGSR